jgi:hypothetical protein
MHDFSRHWVHDPDGIVVQPVDGPQVVAKLKRAFDLVGRMNRAPALRTPPAAAGGGVESWFSKPLFSLLLAMSEAGPEAAATVDVLLDRVLPEARLPFDSSYFNRIVCE